NGQKTGYIDINEVYSEIELSKKYNKYLAALETNLAYQISEARAQKQTVKDVILAKKQPSQNDLELVFKMTSDMDSIEEFYSKTFQDSSEKYNLIVERTVNDLVYDYGLQNKFTYLYSPATSNSFMYADSTLDVTAAVIEYINAETK
ncbi:MAG: Skp family chaperone for outer membrane protein, partial [Saprospiraceae bacterium]